MNVKDLNTDEDINLNIFPNPANKHSIIRFTLPDEKFISLNLVDITGKTVKTIANGVTTQGLHRYEVDLSDVCPGIYFCKFADGRSSITKKLIVTK